MSDIAIKIAELSLAYQSKPNNFVREIILSKPTTQQEVLLNEVAEPGAHVSCRSGHGTGKTTSLAWIVLWFLSCFPNAKIPCTAPTGHQLFDLLWPEIIKWRDRMHSPWKECITVTSDRVSISGLEQLQFAVARTARPENPEALQGFHADNLLFLVDEASGVHEKVFEVAEGALSTPNARVVLTGNPTRTDGYFYRSQHKDRALWKTLHFNCLNSPLVDPAYPEQMVKKYGEDSNIYRVRVLGEFPKASDDVLIALHLIEDAIGRDVKYPVSKRIAGLDVARFGDDANAFVVRKGQSIEHLEQWRDKDLMQTTGKIVEAYREKKLFDEILIDSIGLGSGVVDRLKEMNVPAIGVNVAESSSQKENFMRLRDQLWWSCREFFQEKQCRIEPGLDLIDDLIGELSSVRYTIQSNGKVKVEGKDEMKKRGLPSPNLADALNLTFAEGVSPRVSKTTVRKVIKKTSKGWT